MKTLILHHDNFPDFVGASANQEGSHLVVKPLVQGPVPEDFDDFVCHALDSIFANEQFEKIILPYTFNKEAYLSFDGLAVALHIRLTPQWRHTQTPIVFVGPERAEMVARLSEYGALLITPGIYPMPMTSKEDFESIVANSLQPIGEQAYQQFVKKVKVEQPQNYPSHHAIANRWALQRWHDMFGLGDAGSMQNMLYYKYLRAVIGQQELTFSPDERETPEMNFSRPDVEMVIMDDDTDWQALLQTVFTNSGQPHSVIPIDKKLSKDQLIGQLMNEVNGRAAHNCCYIIDLRLHEDDYTCHYSELTGNIIATNIRHQNRGEQVVILTASDKAWNLKAMTGIGASGYCVKESPEHLLSKTDTRHAWHEFADSLKTAVNMVYLKQLYNTITAMSARYPGANVLYSIIVLLHQDRGKGDDIIMKTCMELLLTFTQTFVNEHYQLDSGELKKADGTVIAPYDKCIVIFKDSFTEGSVTFEGFLRYNYSGTPYAAAPAGWNFLKKDMARDGYATLLATFIIHCHLPAPDIWHYMEMRVRRNTTIGHGKGQSGIKPADIARIISNILQPLIQTTYP